MQPGVCGEPGQSHFLAVLVGVGCEQWDEAQPGAVGRAASDFSTSRSLTAVSKDGDPLDGEGGEANNAGGLGVQGADLRSK